MSAPIEVRWSGVGPIPAIDEQITVTLDKLGPGIVRSYFTQDDWIGLRVELIEPPEFIGKNRRLFGTEIANTATGTPPTREGSKADNERRRRRV